VVRETLAAFKMPVTFGAGVANMGKRAWRPGHAVAARLIVDVRDGTCACIVACFTYVLSNHGTCKNCGHVIMSFDIVIL